jgi:hypothetical protein
MLPAGEGFVRIQGFVDGAKSVRSDGRERIIAGTASERILVQEVWDMSDAHANKFRGGRDFSS